MATFNKSTSLLNVHLHCYLWSILKDRNQKNLLSMIYRASFSLLEMIGFGSGEGGILEREK